MSLRSLLTNQSCTALPAGVDPFPPCHTDPPERVWRSFDGVELPCIARLPESQAIRSVVLIVPGTDGVTSDYSSIIEELLAHGHAVYGCENRTFRYGPGPDHRRGDPSDWQTWVKDLHGFARFVRAQHPEVPMFWHGQSFGAVQVLQAAAECPATEKPDGLIAHSPGFGLMFRKATFLRGLKYGIIAWLRVPWVRLIEIGNMPMTDDPLVDARWKHSSDRLRPGIKVRYFIKAADMGIAARNSSPHLKMPVLAMWGGKDRQGLGGNDKLRAEYDHYMRHELAGGKATLFFRKDGHHLLTEGSTKQEALTAIIHWLDACIARLSHSPSAARPLAAFSVQHHSL